MYLTILISLFLYFATPVSYSIASWINGDFQSLSSSLPLIFGIVIFYILLIRPQNVRMKNHKLALSVLKINDSVVLSSGIYGVIKDIMENQCAVEISPNVTVIVDKECIVKFDVVCLNRMKVKNLSSFKEMIIDKINENVYKKKMDL